MKKLLGITALGSLLAALVLAVAPAWAQNVDSRIQALENELTRLKSEQMELKKEAVAAVAPLPSFSYRPGSGVSIEAADKAWKLQLSHETHFMMPWQEGRDQAGRTLGEVMGRRFRQEWTLCLNNCFYEWISRLDLDGFGTNTALQRGMLNIHFEQVNPWLPTMYLGMEIPSRVATPFRQDSGATGAQMEYDLMSRNNGYNTGRTGNGVGFVWEELPLIPALGIPGRGDASFVYGAQGAGEDGTSRFTDKKDYMLYLRIDPFSLVKNPWISGFSYSIGYYACNNDDRGDSGCTRNRVQDHGPGGRQTLYNSGTAPAAVIGQGRNDFISTGIRWIYGPYRLRAIMGFQNYNDRDDGDVAGALGRGIDNKARNFLIGHDVFIWSPKGLLTGSSSTPGTVLFGYHFERNDFSTGCGTVGKGVCPPTSTITNTGVNTNTGAIGLASQYHRNRVILNEWDLWYFFMSGKSLGISILHYDASNLVAGRRQAQENLGVSGAGKSVDGKGGDWVDVVLGLRVNF